MEELLMLELYCRGPSGASGPAWVTHSPTVRKGMSSCANNGKGALKRSKPQTSITISKSNVYKKPYDVHLMMFGQNPKTSKPYDIR
eukprot:1090733-Prorocentrum_minimum.AAC.1